MAKKKTEKESPFVPVEEQPYRVPGNWCWTYLGVVAQWGSGGTPSRKHKEYYNGDIPWIKTGELNDGIIYDSEEKITQSGLANSSAKLFPTKAIAIAMYGATIGKTGIFGIEATTNQACACGVCTPALNHMYLFYYAQSQRETFIRKGKGGAQPNISQMVIISHEIPIPPLSEQQRIVDRIESLFAKLDEAREKVQDALKSFDIRKSAILRKAFSGELTRQWRTKQGVFASEWKQIQLNDCGDWFGGGTPTTSKAEYWENGDILWITSKDMKCDNITDTLLHITKEGVENSSAVYCDKPAVLFVMRSGILRRIFPVCMVSVPFTVNQDLKAVVPNDKISQRYLFWACTAYEKDIRNKCMKSGTTVESIETKKLLAYSIPLAPIKEQNEIVRILDGFFAREQEAKEKIETMLENIEIMKKSILAKAFRGELGTNNLEDENAEELLKRILA